MNSDEPSGLSVNEKTDLVAFLEGVTGSENVIQRPKLPPYGLLDFPMVNQW